MKKELYRANADPGGRKPAYLWLSHIRPQRPIGAICAWAATIVILGIITTVALLVHSANAKRIAEERAVIQKQEEQTRKVQEEIRQERRAKELQEQKENEEIRERVRREFKEQQERSAFEAARDKR